MPEEYRVGRDVYRGVLAIAPEMDEMKTWARDGQGGTLRLEARDSAVCERASKG